MNLSIHLTRSANINMIIEVLCYIIQSSFLKHFTLHLWTTTGGSRMLCGPECVNTAVCWCPCSSAVSLLHITEMAACSSTYSIVYVRRQTSTDSTRQLLCLSFRQIVPQPPVQGHIIVIYLWIGDAGCCFNKGFPSFGYHSNNPGDHAISNANVQPVRELRSDIWQVTARLDFST